MDVWVVNLVAAALLGVALLWGWRRAKPLRDFKRSTELKERSELDRSERKRWSKLAMSEQVIADPEEARQAEAEARLALRWMSDTRKSIHWWWFVSPMLAVPFLVAAGGWIALAGVAWGLFLGWSYLHYFRMQARLRRTAALNEWTPVSDEER